MTSIYRKITCINPASIYQVLFSSPSFYFSKENHCRWDIGSPHICRRIVVDKKSVDKLAWYPFPLSTLQV